MSGPPSPSPLLAALARGGLRAAEVYLKTGRSRHVALADASELVTATEEAGWAVRAGDRGGSFFACGTGSPPEAETEWPPLAGASLDLPAAESGEPWQEPRELDAPLLAERESLALLAAIDRELAAELPGARLVAADLDEGASESRLVNSRGIDVAWRLRLAALRLEARGPGGRTRVLGVAETEARRLSARGLARQLADSLSVAESGRPPAERRGAMLLAPPVGARLLEGLLPRLVGEPAGGGLLPWADRQGRLGSEVWTVVDDGRLPGGVLAAAWDGVGAPTRRRELVAEGQLPRAGAARPGPSPAGHRRASWRDPPRPGASHLFLGRESRLSPACLIARVERGFYWIEAAGAARFDFEGDRFSLPVLGFALEGGRARSPLSGVAISGTIAALFAGLVAVARDLRFFPADGMIGSPTLLIEGLEIVEAT
ncbi:MAG TPA: metallopeptidase TldD-related protein [Thermoanaerobaculia bacterium]|nr:metallopeptidase TldD-related protein [Thermoanaerobaculia bacterium]